MKTETIQAITPLFLGAIGGILGLAVILSPKISDAKWAAGFGLAGTAIAGASGLAKNSDSTSSVRGNNVSIDSIQSKEEGRGKKEEG